MVAIVGEVLGVARRGAAGDERRVAIVGRVLIELGGAIGGSGGEAGGPAEVLGRGGGLVVTTEGGVLIELGGAVGPEEALGRDDVLVGHVVRCWVGGGAVVAVGGRWLMLMLAARGGVAWCAEVRVLMLMLLMLMLMVPLMLMRRMRMRMVLLLEVSGVVLMVLLWAENVC